MNAALLGDGYQFFQCVCRLPNTIRAITSFSVGFDHIDFAAAKSHGIIVTNTPEVLNDATAEIAMLLLLGAARRAYEGARETRDAMGFGALDNLDAIMSGREPLDRLV